MGLSNLEGASTAGKHACKTPFFMGRGWGI